MKDDFFVHKENVASESIVPEGVSRPTLAQIGLLYSIAVALLIFVGSRVQRREFYSGILITELVLVALPALIMFIIYRYDVKKVLRLNRVSFLNTFLIFWIMVFAIPVVSILNLVNLLLIKYVFGKIEIAQPPVATDAASLILNILVIAGSAGICEEIMFRGVIQRGLERLGAVKAILIAAFLFGMMHVDFQKLLGIFLLGALIGFFVYRTNSLFSGIFAHFINNASAVLLGYGANKMNEVLKSSGMADKIQTGGSSLDFSAFAAMPRTQLIIALVFWAIIIGFCIAVFVALVYAFIRNTSREAVIVVRETESVKVWGLLWLLPGALIVGFIYFAEGLRLRGVSIEAVNSIFSFFGLK